MNFSVYRVRNYTLRQETVATNLTWQEAYNLVVAGNSGWNYRYWLSY